MKKLDKFRINQGINYFKNKIDTGRPLRWVYIYGHHRGGTTYTLNQFLKISKRGTGDWMMHQFAEAFIAAETRERQKMDIDKLKGSFRRNLLANALIGGGQNYDIVIKQATGTKKELQFFTDLFRSEPADIIFAYREPHGWWRSSKIKFDRANDEMISAYCNAFRVYKGEIGGIALEYGKNLNEWFCTQEKFQKIQIEPFQQKEIIKVDDAMSLEETYNGFNNWLKDEQH
jgi:hypothetical protein